MHTINCKHDNQRRLPEKHKFPAIVDTCKCHNGVQMDTNSRNEMFPCKKPRSPQYKRFSERFQTYQNWPHHIKATPTEMAEAGFIYLNQYDRVKCYYCNGGLQNWKYDEEPWMEHAKWYPNCEFLLRCKGVEYVEAVGNMHPNLDRPSLTQYSSVSSLPSYSSSSASSAFSSSSSSACFSSPSMFSSSSSSNYNSKPCSSQSSLSTSASSSCSTSGFTQVAPLCKLASSSSPHSPALQGIKLTLEEAMQKEVVKDALPFGFSESLIRQVVKRKLVAENAEYDSVMSLVDDLIKEDNEEEESAMDCSFEEKPTSVKPNLSKSACRQKEIYNKNINISQYVEPVKSEKIIKAPESLSFHTSPAEKKQTSLLSSIPSTSQESRRNKEEIDRKMRSMQEEKTCKVCLDRESDCVFTSCGHLCCCVQCASALSRCPICRSQILQAMKVYR